MPKVYNACNYLAEQNKIDYKDRVKELKEILKKYKSKGYYDCIVPWSGGKDSSYIAHRLKFEFGMNPLLVTFAPLIPTTEGMKNRENLINLGFDHYYFRLTKNIETSFKKIFLKGETLKYLGSGANLFH